MNNISRRAFVSGVATVAASAAFAPVAALAASASGENSPEGFTLEDMPIDETTGFPIVKFGSYRQAGIGEARKGDEPIEWLVLEVRDDGTALLLSRKCLSWGGYHTFHGTEHNVTWESCELRKWLNDEFLETAFSEEERSLIVEQNLANPDNPDYGTPGGADTEDLVFCLSLPEVEALFGVASDGRDQRLIACSTKYVLPSAVTEFDGVYWWLRSPGKGANRAAGVYPDGSVHSDGWPADASIAVRPALVVHSIASLGRRYVEFGNYPQSGKDPEPIQWLVLEERDDGTALLLSRRCLTTRSYHGEHGGRVTWEECDLRAWLNGEFMESAFSEGERARIVVQHLKNPDNQSPGGADADDSVFCLSLQEIERCFGAGPDDIDSYLVAYPTLRAVEEGAILDPETGACHWWLRSPGDFWSDYAALVYDDGYVDSNGTYVDDDDTAVRPALVVNLNP